MTFLAIIGAITLFVIACGALIVLLAIGAEIRRAYRQTCRRSRVAYGHEWARLARKNWMGFLRLWRKEIFSSYSALVMRGIRLPHDPRKPFGRKRF